MFKNHQKVVKICQKSTKTMSRNFAAAFKIYLLIESQHTFVDKNMFKSHQKVVKNNEKVSKSYVVNFRATLFYKRRLLGKTACQKCQKYGQKVVKNS